MLGERVDAQLILENGMRFVGKAFGHIGDAAGEVVFTTGMTGYQEMITDPSHAGQIVVMTYPLVGNAGINLEDMESDKGWLSGLIVREKCDEPSNWRCEMSLDGFMKQHKLMGLEGVDTRALTRVIRENGAMRGVITTDMSDSTSHAYEEASASELISRVTCSEKYTVSGSGMHVAVIDLGVGKSVLSELTQKGCRLTVFPAVTKAEEILAENPDHIFISNGPGDPKGLPEVVEMVKALLPLKPVSGVGLGHLLLALAMGCETERMHFGHHGGNHPVRELQSGRVWITSQGHIYVVSALANDVEATFVHVNDGSIEGIRHKSLPVSGIQFYPEDVPGTGWYPLACINL